MMLQTQESGKYFPSSEIQKYVLSRKHSVIHNPYLMHFKTYIQVYLGDFLTRRVDLFYSPMFVTSSSSVKMIFPEKHKYLYWALSFYSCLLCLNIRTLFLNLETVTAFFELLALLTWDHKLQESLYHPLIAKHIFRDYKPLIFKFLQNTRNKNIFLGFSHQIHRMKTRFSRFQKLQIFAWY